MNKTIIANWQANKALIRNAIKDEPPGNYEALVNLVVKHVGRLDSFKSLDYNNIVTIDHGHYQGTLLFIIPEDTYQPDNYWFVKVSYGSCSVCDTFESVRERDDEDLKLNGFMSMALHIAQGLKRLEGVDSDL